ncbi:glycosyltransferase [Vibrio litoralis]|uniref:glycosyltransferase n=1 Tax=Vibrio litoralis TaxID=335972 RepID=UPI001867ABE2|nr:glycosyltransferase [Vibrio litoralis]
MKISFIDSYYDSLGGAPKSMLTLASLLIKEKFTVNLVSLDQGRVTELAESLGVNVIMTSKGKTLLGRRQKSLSSILNFLIHLFTSLFYLPKDQNVVCINEPRSLYYYFLYLLYIKTFSGNKTQIVYYVRINEKLGLTNFILSRLCHKIILISSDSKRAFSSRDISKFKEKFVIIHTGFDFNDVSLPNVDNSEEKVIQLCSIGTFCDRKNQLLALEVLSATKKAGLNCVMNFYGDDTKTSPYLESLKSEIKANSLEKSVNFHGYSNDIVEDIKGCHIYVMTSKVEGLPRSVIEAAYAGLFIVSVECDGVGDIIVDPVQGIITDYQPSSLVSAILDYLENNDVYNVELIKRRREIIRNSFSTDAYVNNFISMVSR